MLVIKLNFLFDFFAKREEAKADFTCLFAIRFNVESKVGFIYVLNGHFPVKGKTAVVFSCSVIYDIPDIVKGKQIGQACDGEVYIIIKVNEQYYKVLEDGVTGYLFIGSIKSPYKTTNKHESSNKTLEIKKVYSCSPIYDVPDMVKGKQIEQACDGKVTIISKFNPQYYRVLENGVKGYLLIGSLKE